MWGWPTAHSTSSSNFTPPNFQAASHFSIAAHHTSSSVPFSHTSQAPISAHSQFPHSFYPLEYTNKHPTPTPWNIDISKHDSNPSIPHHHHHIGSNSFHDSNPSNNSIGEPPTGLASSQQHVVDHHGSGSFQQHKVSSNTLSTNSPFSMDFILQKPAAPIDNAGLIGHYNDQPSGGFSGAASYHQATPILPSSHNQYNQAQSCHVPLPTHSQTQSDKYGPVPAPVLDSHELHPFTTANSMQVNNNPYVDQTYPTTVGSGERMEHFQPSPVPHSFNSDTTAHVGATSDDTNRRSKMISNDIGSGLVGGLPPTEESYSPPELVLRKSDNSDQQHPHHHHRNYEQSSSSSNSENDGDSQYTSGTTGSGYRATTVNTTTAQHNSQLRVPRPVSFGTEDGDYDDDDSSTGEPPPVIMSTGFQLAASPQQPPSSLLPPTTRPSADSGSTSSNSTSSGTTTNSSVSSSTSIHGKGSNEIDKNTSTSVSSSASNSSSSSSSSEEEELKNSTTTGHQHHDQHQLVSASHVEESKESRPNVLSNRVSHVDTVSAPPPLVPTHTVSNNDNEFEGDNDDVFLPSSPPDNKDDSSVSRLSNDGSFPLNKGERKTASVVVGKRGRAAGRILDEDKLRVPLANGWQRIVRTRLGESNGPTRVDICYVTPCKRRLRTFPEIQRYIDQNRSINLTIDNFSFSKKVNVGVVINEETLMNNATEELSRPRRGRPPKHLLALKEKTKEGQDFLKKDTTRISLEPHEIGINKGHGNLMITEKEEPMESHHSLLPPVAASSSSYCEDKSDTVAHDVIVDNHPRVHLPQPPQSPSINNLHVPPPPLVKAHSGGTTKEITMGASTRRENIKGTERRGWKRRATSVGDKTPAFKKPRGRPKGPGSRTSSGGRKPRVPRTVKYIPPPQQPSLTINDTAASTAGATPGGVPPTISSYSHSTTINGDDAEEGRDSVPLPTSNPRIKKQLEDKEKRRKLLMKAREGGGGKKRQSSTLHQRSQRKLAQQARRERERMVKTKQNEIMKQKEVEMEEIRKSRLARQKENEYRQQALERTRNLMEQLRKQEEERERLARLRQLDIERAEQLRKPTEDLLVKNLTTLPPLPKMELVCLSSKAFLDLVTIFQFTNSFEEFLDLDSVPQLPDLYCGLFNAQWVKTKNVENNDEEMVVATSSDKNSVIQVLIQMVKAVTHDPGTKTQTLTGCSLRDIEVKEHTVSEIIRLYLSKEDNIAIQKICKQLNHIPFPSLRPSEKTRVLSFLTEELLRSSSLCKEIDNRMEQVCTLRRIKWKISLKLKRFRSRFNDCFGAENLAKPILYGGRGRPPKKPSAAINLHNDVDSSDEEGGGGGDDPNNSSEDESDFTDEDSDEEPSEDREELHRRIKEIRKKINCIRSKINTASQQMRVFPLGQDRYSRQYWSLPKMSGVVVEGIDTSTFDALEKYISDITQRRELQLQKDANTMCLSDTLKVSNSANTAVISGCLSNDSRESSIAPPVNHTSFQTKVESDPSSSIQHSDGEAESRRIQVPAGVDTPAIEFTPNPSPPLSNSLNNSFECSPEKIHHHRSITATVSDRPLEERHQLSVNTNTSRGNRGNRDRIITDVSQANIESTNTDRHTTTSTDNTPWFSILPRKQCEVLHYLQLDSAQQQGVMLGGSQFLGGGNYAYMTPDGTILGQPLMQQLQMGYALMGNNIVQVPQTQYVLATTGGAQPDGSSVTAAALGAGGNNQQLISLGDGQYALAAAATPSNNIQYVSINGNQYAIMQPPTQDIKANGIANASSETNPETYSQSLVPQSQPSSASTSSGKKEKSQGSSSAGGRQSKRNSTTPTPQVDVMQQQQLITLAIPGNNGEEPQYVQVPADPRVMSGECSYAVLPQADGTSQIVLVEKNSLPDSLASTQPTQSDETAPIECPHAVVMDNEQECDPWCVDITLMYADTPLPFANNGASPAQKQYQIRIDKDEYMYNKEDEKKLSQLLEQIDKDLTHGWWSITGQLEFEHLIRCLTMRGFREKNLHKLLSKNKDILCHTMGNVKSILPETLTKSLQSLVKGSIKAPDESHCQASNNEQSLQLNKDEMVATDVTNEQMEVDVDGEGSSLVESGHNTTNGSVVEKTLVLPDTALGSPVEWDPFFTKTIGEGVQQIVEYLEGMEARLFDAHLPIEGSQKSILSDIGKSLSNTIASDNHHLTNLSLIADGLLRLEACVQRRYLKRPFKEKHADTRKSSPGDSPIPVEEPLALLKWRSAVSSASSSSQLGVCMNQLERCIAWEKSPMKVFCVVCRTGDNESLLLLCDKCDRGTHTYCCKPKLDEIPEGNWYCHDCVINASRKTVCNVCDTARGVLLHCTECPTVIHKRCHNPPLTRIPNGPWQCFTCRRQNKRIKSNHMKDELILCYELLKELEEHDDSWPFLQPVDKKKVPGYYKVIKKPMDFSTVKSKLLEGRYSNKEAFAADARQVFDNCSYYNEDDSEIGIAGHRMKQFFEKKWTELAW